MTMAFEFIRSTKQESPILIPQIGLTLRVRVGPPLHAEQAGV